MDHEDQFNEAEGSSTFSEERKSKAKRRRGFCTNLANYVTEYTQTTSLHGVRYLGERQRPLLEKIWWLCVLVTSLYFCISLILKAYNRWDTSPVIVSFAQRPTPIWQIPFPAVTVCPETKTRQSIFNFTHFYHLLQSDNNTMTSEEMKHFTDLAVLCDWETFDQGNDTTDHSLIDFLFNVAPALEDTLLSCKWNNMNLTCADLFTPALTEEGICFSFNMLDWEDIFTKDVFHSDKLFQHNTEANGWTLEAGYRPNAGKDAYPRRAISAGQASGLAILLRENIHDMDYLCRGPAQGFKILLHHPGQAPRMATQYFRVPLNQELVVTIKPQMMTMSNNLRNYDPYKRHCYFSSERQLRFYKTYTQKNCDVECLANFTLRTCGCVSYSMPHDNATRICSSRMQTCMADALNELLDREVMDGLASYNKPSTDKQQLECDCLPECASLSYAVEKTQVEFSWKGLLQAYGHNFTTFQGEIQLSEVKLFFNEKQFIASTRNELYGSTDFLANCGGLLGLFVGFSFLSAIEIFYFLTFRLWCNIKRFYRPIMRG